MQPDPSRRLPVVVRHPVPLIARGIVAALSNEVLHEVPLEVAEWAGQMPPGGLLLADVETALQLAMARPPERAGSGTPRLVALGTHGSETEVRAALDTGLDGYLLGTCSLAELQACVRTVAAGRRYLSEAALRCLVDSLAHDPLTAKEQMVLHGLCEGMSNKAIARRLDLAVGTVKCHVRAILAKLDAGNRTQAVKVALARGLADELPRRPMGLAVAGAGAPRLRDRAAPRPFG